MASAVLHSKLMSLSLQFDYLFTSTQVNNGVQLQRESSSTFRDQALLHEGEITSTSIAIYLLRWLMISKLQLFSERKINSQLALLLIRHAWSMLSIDTRHVGSSSTTYVWLGLLTLLTVSHELYPLN